MGRDRYPKQSLGSLHSLIKTSHVLMVGAGGIGCELLKNIVLTGFGEVHVVDLDTIDLSNLNRQFLFRHEHIKKSKALVAKESAQKFNRNVKIEAHHANIKDPQFTIDWFSSFAVVFNALDNLDARRHVNRMCLAADVPLIESGTTGYNGQVQVIKKSRTECYDCNVKETPKSFPVCTIRSTPSQPIHCIVWAKSYLFTEIFGTSEDDSPELDHSEKSNDKGEMDNLWKETQALKAVRDSMGSTDFPRKVFTKVFTQDIERLRSMEDMWKTRKPPKPLDFDEVSRQAMEVGPEKSRQDQVVWTLAENFAVFKDSLRRLSDRLNELKANAEPGSPPILTFDKDDVDTLDFVAATANLRSIIFGIDTRSKFDIKQMAGNIIPAIATTNAMTAGLCVLQAFKVLKDDLRRAKMVFLANSTERVISSEPLRPPRPDCPVCGVAQSRLLVDTSRATLNDLVDGLLSLQLGYGQEISIISSDDNILYEPELTDNLPKKFVDLGIKGDSFLTVIDEEDEDPRVNLVLSISDQSLPDDSKPLVIPQTIQLGKKSEAAGAQLANGSSTTVSNGINGKRKREPDDDELPDEQAKKRGKVALTAAQPSDQEVVVLDDAETGAILIEDD